MVIHISVNSIQKISNWLHVWFVYKNIHSTKLEWAMVVACWLGQLIQISNFELSCYY